MVRSKLVRRYQVSILCKSLDEFIDYEIVPLIRFRMFWEGVDEGDKGKSKRFC